MERHDAETTMMRQKLRRSWPRRASRTLTPAVAFVILVGLGSPAGASASSSVALHRAPHSDHQRGRRGRVPTARPVPQSDDLQGHLSQLP